MWARNGRWILLEMPDFHVAFRNLLHAVNLWHGTDGFTSPPKEGALRIFSPWKIRRLQPGLNPWTWVPKASTLPLDHRSHFNKSFTSDLKTTQWYFETWSGSMCIVFTCFVTSSANFTLVVARALSFLMMGCLEKNEPQNITWCN